MNRMRFHSRLKDKLAQEDNDSANQPQGAFLRGLHAWMMPLCLILMGSAFLLVMWRGQASGGAWLLLPMMLCLGMHLLMHRHGHSHRDD
ncbi:hypothetical protein [Halomonas sp. A29]|uniref:hypothetical protein n=1 Tax=Halomonas sp. A29 TaxID=3102786 RepID=UPI00398B186E